MPADLQEVAAACCRQPSSSLSHVARMSALEQTVTAAQHREIADLVWAEQGDDPIVWREGAASPFPAAVVQSLVAGEVALDVHVAVLLEALPAAFAAVLVSAAAFAEPPLAKFVSHLPISEISLVSV